MVCCPEKLCEAPRHRAMLDCADLRPGTVSAASVNGGEFEDDSSLGPQFLVRMQRKILCLNLFQESLMKIKKENRELLKIEVGLTKEANGPGWLGCRVFKARLFG